MKRPIAEAMSGAHRDDVQVAPPGGVHDGLPFRYEIRS